MEGGWYIFVGWLAGWLEAPIPLKVNTVIRILKKGRHGIYFRLPGT